VNHHTTAKYWECYQNLPPQIKTLANRNFKLLKENPNLPSLSLKKIENLWSVRIGKKYRALAIEYEGCMIWFWVGNHSDYEKMLKK